MLIRISQTVSCMVAVMVFIVVIKVKAALKIGVDNGP